jgi:hypothetical protein
MTHNSESPKSDEADRLAGVAFWITLIGIFAFSGAVYTFVL